MHNFSRFCKLVSTGSTFCATSSGGLRAVIGGLIGGGVGVGIGSAIGSNPREDMLFYGSPNIFEQSAEKLRQYVWPPKTGDAISSAGSVTETAMLDK